MTNGLRASASRDNPQVARLTTVGQGDARQFGVRTIVNPVTGAGVIVLLLLLGVDFPLLWGIRRLHDSSHHPLMWA
jgi:predicted PurR-regulated permease PerM